MKFSLWSLAIWTVVLLVAIAPYWIAFQWGKARGRLAEKKEQEGRIASALRALPREAVKPSEPDRRV